MAIGPIQLLVIGFDHPDFQGEVLDEIERLRESDTIRLIDSLTVVKSADGDVASMRLGNLSEDESIELGSKIGALIGLGYAGEEGAESGAELGAEYAASTDAGVFTEEDAWDVVASIPRDSAAALLLIEHHWAVPLRDALGRAGGFRIDEGFIDPVDLVAIGLMTAEEAEAHTALVAARD